MYDVMQGSCCVHTIEGNGEPIYVKRRREPSGLGTAPYDPLIDIAYEQIKKKMGGELGRQAHVRVERAGGMEHIEAMRMRIKL